MSPRAAANLNAFARLELAVGLVTSILATGGYLAHSTVLEFFAVLTGVIATTLVVARLLLTAEDRAPEP